MGNVSSSPEARQKRAKHGGSLVHMIKQDPTLTDEGYTFSPVWLPGGVRVVEPPDDVKKCSKNVNCLMSEDVVMGSFFILQPTDDDGNFLIDLKTREGVGASGLATIQMVMTMYRRALKRMGVMDHLNWRSGKELLFLPKMVIKDHIAFYVPHLPGVPTDRNMIVGVMLYEDKENYDKFMTSASWFDAIAHEAGHGILNSLRPTWTASKEPEPDAFNEAFGDITVLLMQISQLDVCEKAIVAAKGDLHTKTFFVKLCETLGEAMLKSDCLRNLDNDYAIDEVTEEEHDLSQVFTGAFYDIMVDIYDDKTDLSMYNPALVLYKTGEHMMELLLRCVLDLPDERVPGFQDLATSLLNAEKNEKYKAIIQKHFDRRKIFDPSAKPKPIPPKGEKSVSAKERTIKCGKKESVEALIQKDVEEAKAEAEKE